MSLPRYERYKESGVEWLGEVPEHWGVKRIGYYFNERREKVSDKDYPALSVTKNGIVPQLDTAAKSDDGDNRKKVCKGDFVINSRSDRKGSSGSSDLEGSVSLICTVIRPQEHVYTQFVHHLLRCQLFQEEFYRNGKGIVADLWSTNYSEMRNILLGMPPLPEQHAIADFLDRETAKIDALIAEQQRLIGLLAEKRQATISHAVTKGLNPNASMKDSGVEWLGEVPEHWEVKKLGYLLSESPKNGRSPEITAAGVIPTFSIAAVKNGRASIQSHLKYTSIDLQDAHPYFLKQFDILVLRGNGSKELVGTAGIVVDQPPENCIYPDILIRVRPNNSILPSHLVSCLNSSALRPQIQTAAQTAAGIWKISGRALQGLRLPLPPLAEQNEIERHLQIISMSFDALTAEAQRAIALLQERRIALISAAVTGKIDVRSLTEREAA
ncbi:MAG: type I restriction endonuclease subunit S [Deltaproteobacteria bacterium HGW-Deltaproteobacteria-16]|nr:MAG: type I restriction endonuclease subunit S [Deltaproteobacteria bacterium HGW-Deltaproteobacteria-16]